MLYMVIIDVIAAGMIMIGTREDAMNEQRCIDVLEIEEIDATPSETRSRNTTYKTWVCLMKRQMMGAGPVSSIGGRLMILLGVLLVPRGPLMVFVPVAFLLLPCHPLVCSSTEGRCRFFEYLQTTSRCRKKCELWLVHN